MLALSRDGVIIRFMLGIYLLLPTGTGILTGGLATLSGVFGVVELATGLLLLLTVARTFTT